MRKQILIISMGILLLPSCTKKNLNKIEKVSATKNIKMEGSINNEEGKPLVKGQPLEESKSIEGPHGGPVGGVVIDMIGLSAKKFVVSSKAQTIEINTEKQWWWLNDIMDNGKHLNFDHLKTQKKAYKFTGENFDLERATLQKLIVHLKENTSGKARKIELTFQAGNYFDGVEIVQN